MITHIYKHTQDIKFLTETMDDLELPLDIHRDRELIIDELKHNIIVAKEACELIGYDFNELLDKK